MDDNDFDVNLLAGMFDGDGELTEAQLERSKMGCQIIGETVFSLNQAKWQTLTVALARASRVKITGLPLETFSFVQKEHVGIEPVEYYDLIGIHMLQDHPSKRHLKEFLPHLKESLRKVTKQRRLSPLARNHVRILKEGLLPELNRILDSLEPSN